MSPVALKRGGSTEIEIRPIRTGEKERANA